MASVFDGIFASLAIALSSNCARPLFYLVHSRFHVIFEMNKSYLRRYKTLNLHGCSGHDGQEFPFESTSGQIRGLTPHFNPSLNRNGD